MAYYVTVSIWSLSFTQPVPTAVMPRSQLQGYCTTPAGLPGPAISEVSTLNHPSHGSSANSYGSLIIFFKCKKNIRATTKAFKLIIIINRHTGFKKEKKMKVKNVNPRYKLSQKKTYPSSPPPWIHTHTPTHSHPTYIHTPLPAIINQTHSHIIASGSTHITQS